MTGVSRYQPGESGWQKGFWQQWSRKYIESCGVTLEFIFTKFNTSNQYFGQIITGRNLSRLIDCKLNSRYWLKTGQRKAMGGGSISIFEKNNYFYW